MALGVLRHSKNNTINTWIADVVFSCEGELRYSLMSSPTCVVTQKMSV